MYKDVVDPQHRSLNLLHCWHILRHEEKWINQCTQRNQKGAANGSLGNTPGTSESHEDKVGECHTSPRKDARPPGKKKAKEQQRQGKNSGSPVQKIYMDALETMWSKKKECEDLKEREKEKSMMICSSH
jgi:hypothetical protein